jgi:hypothetical protein
VGGSREEYAGGGGRGRGREGVRGRWLHCFSPLNYLIKYCTKGRIASVSTARLVRPPLHRQTSVFIVDASTKRSFHWQDAPPPTSRHPRPHGLCPAPPTRSPAAPLHTRSFD